MPIDVGMIETVTYCNKRSVIPRIETKTRKREESGLLGFIANLGWAITGRSLCKSVLRLDSIKKLDLVERRFEANGWFCTVNYARGSTIQQC